MRSRLGALIAAACLTAITIPAALGFENAPFCPPDPAIPAELENLAAAAKAAEKKLSHFSASDNQVKAAKCARSKPYTEAEINQWLDAYFSGSSERRSETINGIQFENESPRALELFRTLVTPEIGIGGKPAFSAVQFTSDCKKVRCALGKVFGEKAGPKLAFMLGKFGMNGSHHAFQYAADWKNEELDTVLLALSDIPEKMLPLNRNKQLTHVTRGPATGTTLANASIQVFNVWNTQTPHAQRYTIFHELGHYIGGEFDFDMHPEWFKAGGWEVKPGSQPHGGKYSPYSDYMSSRPKSMVSGYAQENPLEDFAESFSAYRYNPESLRTKSPEKYAFMRDVLFGGREFTPSATCSSKSLLDRLTDYAKASGSALVGTRKTTETAMTHCGPQLASLALAQLDDCLQEGAAAAVMKEGCVALNCSKEQLLWLDRVRSDIRMNSANHQKLRQNVLRNTEALYAEGVLAIDQSKSLSYRLSDRSSATPQDFCKSWSEYAYQRVDKAFNRSFGKNDFLFSYRQAAAIEHNMQELCVIAQQRFPERRTPLSREDAVAAVQSYFSRLDSREK